MTPSIIANKAQEWPSRANIRDSEIKMANSSCKLFAIGLRLLLEVDPQSKLHGARPG